MFARYVDIITVAVLALIRYPFFYIVLYASQFFILFNSRFSYRNIPEATSFPFFLGAWANFDGEHYLRIAREGYIGINRAFFPLYPYLVKIVSIVYDTNIFIIGLVVSNALFLINIFFLAYLLKRMFKVEHVQSFILLFLAFPTAFFFSALYTESLFLFTILLSFWGMHKKTRWLSLWL